MEAAYESVLYFKPFRKAEHNFVDTMVFGIPNALLFSCKPSTGAG